ncbi:MAG: ATP-binding protein [Nitrospira sp. BO4]|nr:ATP-binding protein [Nitrospira sp. BO4]
MKPFRFRGIMVWVTITGVMLVALSIVFITILERQIIDRAGTHNREIAFVLLSQSVSAMISQAGGIQDVRALEGLIHEIIEIHPEILRLSVYEISPQSSSLIASTESQLVPTILDSQERAKVEARGSVMQLEDASGERAVRMTAPIEIDGKVVGALRGLFSVKEYDDLIKQETELAKSIGIGVVAVTSLTLWLLIRVKVHRPVHRLLHAIRSVEAENLSSHPLTHYPSEIQEVAIQFNKMLDRVREAGIEKDALLDKVRHFNETLQIRVAEATEELQRANLELVEARLAAERSQRLAALGEFSATVAHELGNPLNALSGHLQMLTGTTDSASRHRHLAVIRSEVNRMVSIIKQLLDQTRMQLRSARVNLNGTIQEVTTLLSPGLPRQHVTLKTDLQDDLPPVAGDARALHGLLFNLVTNAIQAMPLGGELTIRTRIACGERPPGIVMVGEGAPIEEATVRLTIGDTGTGIPSEHLPRIFEPFFTTRHDQGGTGLGLAICHRVVTDSGGRLAVKSHVGHGTEFTIDLPIWNTERNIRRHQ